MEIKIANNSQNSYENKKKEVGVAFLATKTYYKATITTTVWYLFTCHTDQWNISRKFRTERYLIYNKGRIAE